MNASRFRALILSGLSLLISQSATGQSLEKRLTMWPVIYRTVKVNDVTIFYRESGPRDAPVILLLHGFPSSSRMFEPLFARLSGRYHLIAPDYPGFGHSDAPDPKVFAYTFDHIALLIEGLTNSLGLAQYALYMQDYGGPVGFRVAMAHPERITALIFQNAAAHEDALGPLWDQRKAFWKNRSENEEALRSNFTSLAATRQRHLGSDPHTELYDPDLWTDEFAFLSRSGMAQIQSDLFYDYRNNVIAYPAWQAWLRRSQPPTLVLWGKYDPSFQVGEVEAYRRDLPSAEVHVLDAGHFALDTAADEISDYLDSFLQRQQRSSAVEH
jgi:pimeloyl-ACP methyl ester carboxylesterase